MVVWFEYSAKVKKIVEEDVDLILEAEDEVEAEEKAIALLSGDDTVRAKRYHVRARHHHIPEDIELTPVRYEDDGPQYA
jgi:hypothetical protein